MPSLNEIDEELISKDYLIDVLLFLDQENHRNLYGFYLKFLKISIKSMRLQDNGLILSNIKKLLKLFLEVKINLIIF